MLDDSVPSPDEEQDAAPGGESTPRRRRRRWLVGGALLVLTAGIASALVIRTPYVIIEPGRLRPTAERVEISGADRFESDGRLFFMTVSSEQANLFDLAESVIDEAVEVRRTDEVAPGGDLQRSRVENKSRMDVSKTLAQRVALEYLGYQVADGVEVVKVVDGGPSQGVLTEGMIITAIDGRAIQSERQLREVLGSHRPGDAIAVTARPDTRDTVLGGETAAGTGETTVTVTLGSAPDPNSPGATRAVMGIMPRAHDREQLPISISIDSGEVGGPSAGLAFTVTLIDLLTPGDMTKGGQVAITGEIRRDGSVGRIGGLLQKASAALRRGGVTELLYPAETPADEVDEVRRLVDGRFELRAVATVDEAVEILNGTGLRP